MVRDLAKNQKRLDIAICGIRGIPARYGGFETFAEQLAPRLVEKGHRVCVYGRSYLFSDRPQSFRGVALRYLPAVRFKYLETPLHTLFCLLDLLRRKCDVVLVCNAANSPFIWIARLFGKPVVVNVDGIERLRGKWNALGRLWYRLGEITSVGFASRLVTDADMIHDYYQQNYRASSTVIRYGCLDEVLELARNKVENSDFPAAQAVHQELGISPDQYILYVSRLEPENNAHIVIAAYNALAAEHKAKPLVIVGDAPYASSYIDKLKRDAGKNVIFAGYRFNEQYRALALGASIYVQATEVGGTHPALVEAMGFGNCVIANDVPEHREVLADAGYYYQKNSASDLSALLQRLIGDQRQRIDARRRAYSRAKSDFSWESITEQYEALFLDCSR